MDIFFEWRKVMGENAGMIMAFTVDLVKQYWKLTEQPRDIEMLNAYRRDVMSGDYNYLISASAEFILNQTGIQLPVDYLLRDTPRQDDE